MVTTYLFFFSSGVIWETKKINGSRYKPLTQKECELIETAYIRYTRMLEIGENEPIVLIKELNIEVFCIHFIFQLFFYVKYSNLCFRLILQKTLSLNLLKRI
jgi:hypothetical protein